MLAKLVKAFTLLRQDLMALKGDVQRIEKVRQVVRHGKDGVSPDPAEIVAAVLEQIPAPKDGVSPDPEAIAKLVPPAKPGRDAIPPTVRDVADVVLAKIEKPKDGVSPDPAAIAKLIPRPKDGVSPTAEEVAKKMPNPQRGKTGAPGKNGVSVTDVQLKNNELFVFLDGKKRSVGKVKIPAASAPFSPGADAGGGGSLRGVGLAEFGVITITANFNASNRQIIICRNTVAIEVTLNPVAKIGDRVHVKRRGGDIRIMGTVDGVTDPLISALRADSVHLVFDGTDWNQI